ncbi:hypothetical protein VCRA2113O117_80112 [Vibrio crassostreae]|nr:hypothetical protein VCRA2114E123_80112 [Vibrio crassostreae]CAK2353037.1 hypothetical protein VCRA2112O114_50112 [Vibrio crassostreae]CAK3072677.1 hypothetical protein VCRA2113O117_80112 [Vibrio crassostreae]CAK3088846.1 hypothetical protein VCRA217O111_70112 [Vibrio crassostreae]CAK3568399.1 hypothetical protein VCRA2126E132_70112 [Vibrio crassostreae]
MPLLIPYKRLHFPTKKTLTKSQCLFINSTSCTALACDQAMCDQAMCDQAMCGQTMRSQD